MALSAAVTNKRYDLKFALALMVATFAWLAVEGGASLWLAALSRSLLLLAFGIDSVIEMLSAAVVTWRLCVDARTDRDQARVERAERTAGRFAGALLYALAAFVAAVAVYGLAHRHTADTQISTWGITVGVAAKVAMPLLAAAKLRVAARLGSRALRADAMEAVTCGWLAVAMTIGLAAERLLGWWWLDSAASLAILPLLVREAREAMSGHCGCCAEGGKAEC